MELPGIRSVTYDEQEKWLRMQRGKISVICNLGAESGGGAFPVARETEILLASHGDPRVVGSEVTLPPDAVVGARRPCIGLRKSCPSQKCRICLEMRIALSM